MEQVLMEKVEEILILKKFMRKKYVSIKNQKLLIKENIIMRKKFEKF